MNETERENYENWLSQFPFKKNNATMEPFHCKVVGVVDENLETGINRQDIIKTCKVGQSLMLLPEPTTPTTLQWNGSIVALFFLNGN